jgi:hypothetical protein
MAALASVRSYQSVDESVPLLASVPLSTVAEFVTGTNTVSPPSEPVPSAPVVPLPC